MNRPEFMAHIGIQQERTDMSLAKKDMHAAGSGKSLSRAGASLESITRVHYRMLYIWTRRCRIAAWHLEPPK